MPKQKEVLSGSAKRFADNMEQNVFVMMRFRETTLNRAVRDTIKCELLKFGLTAVIADEAFFEPTLWENIKFYMDNSRYGISVFEDEGKPAHNPNVILETGYMLALRRPCLLLKENHMRQFPTDLLGHLSHPFDGGVRLKLLEHETRQRVYETLTKAIRDWAKNDLGRSAPEIISGQTIDEAITKRARRIAEILREQDSSCEGTPVIRIAATMSSLAISDRETWTTPETLDALIDERRSALEWFEKGEVRLIISPDAILQRIGFFSDNTESFNGSREPRYLELIQLIRERIGNIQFQIVYVPPQLDRNVIIRNKSAMITGLERLSEAGIYESTVSYESMEIERQISIFDSLFNEAAALIMRSREQDIERVGYDRHDLPKLRPDELASANLKNLVIQHLEESHNAAVEAARRNDPVN